MKKKELKSSEYNEYYKNYIDKLSDEIELKKGYTTGKQLVIEFFTSIPKDKLAYRYQPGKWTIKEVFQHQIDTERIFMYRCFRIARRDSAPLMGYDQDIYVVPSQANNKSIEELVNEFETTRNNSINIIHSLTNEDLCFIGNASESAMSARAAAFIILGHDKWHIDVIKNKYL